MRSEPRIAVIGAGVAGAMCARTLADAGVSVRVFDKARGVGGRLCTRRVDSLNPAADALTTLHFDHGAPLFDDPHGRAAGLTTWGEQAGWLQRWQPRWAGALPTGSCASLGTPAEGWVAVPGQPALCRAVLSDIETHCGYTVAGVQRRPDGWHLQGQAGQAAADAGPFDAVLLAIPPLQASALLQPMAPAWAAALAAQPMQACWTLMASSPYAGPGGPDWQMLSPEDGPLALVIRDDLKPGRTETTGHSRWVAHASPAWSTEHLEDEPAAVAAILGAALRQALGMPVDEPLTWAAAHRWRYAVPAPTGEDTAPAWLDATLGLGVCGDALAGRGVADAAHSGLALARMWLDQDR